MVFLVLIPLLCVFGSWRQRQISQTGCRRVIDRLVFLRQLLRSSVVLPVGPPDTRPLHSIIRQASDSGLSCSSALNQCVLWLRVVSQHGSKGCRIAGLWLARMLAVTVLAFSVRVTLTDRFVSAIAGIDALDTMLMGVGALVIMVSSMLFLRMVPGVKVDETNGVAGSNLWLRNRILADNGQLTVDNASDDVANIEREEICSGLSLYGEKVEAFDSIWRERISAMEAKCEAALEIMPVLEFVGFGGYLVCLLISPLLQFTF